MKRVSYMASSVLSFVYSLIYRNTIYCNNAYTFPCFIVERELLAAKDEVRRLRAAIKAQNEGHAVGGGGPAPVRSSPPGVSPGMTSVKREPSTRRPPKKRMRVDSEENLEIPDLGISDAELMAMMSKTTSKSNPRFLGDMHLSLQDETDMDLELLSRDIDMGLGAGGAGDRIASKGSIGDMLDFLLFQVLYLVFQCLDRKQIR